MFANSISRFKDRFKNLHLQNISKESPTPLLFMFFSFYISVDFLFKSSFETLFLCTTNRQTDKQKYRKTDRRTYRLNAKIECPLSSQMISGPTERERVQELKRFQTPYSCLPKKSVN